MDLLPGYQFYPSIYSPALGSPKVDIYLTSEPSGRFFDAFQATFPVMDEGAVKELQVEHPWEEWMGSQKARVVAGRFQLREKDQDAHCGFSLGGEISIQNTGQATLCVLTSSAPIFNLSDDPDSTGALIVNEIEALLAKREAAWGENENTFTARLASVEPLTLFIIILHTLDLEIESLPASVRNHGFQEVLHQIKKAIHILKEAGVWPDHIPNIQDIL
jgi:hypothetical protein